ncbi:MAG: GTPase Era [Ignavibacteria bacterium RIFOXYB2_FULL_36_7]|nr:MAG: GTPase Era [Ignavibacteria bacterium RIFOXYB2_FULL_36_7]
MNTKSGYVAILGLPNAGKSTLMNALLGQKLSITTSKPQTTRKQILGILSSENYQAIFLDTPGIIKPGYLLQEKMMEAVSRSVKNADIIVLIIDVSSDPEGKQTLNNIFIAEKVSNTEKPFLLLLNKIDLTQQEKVRNLISKLEPLNKFNKIIPVSALLNFNIEEVLGSIVELLPEGPKYYPDDIVADENERFFVSEIVREKVFELYKEEIPYGTEVIIVDFKEREDKKDYILAEVIVERESQKGILIGKKGAALKKLGLDARKSVEEFLQKEVYLELKVKVKNKWRSDEKQLRSFGYIKPEE